jgi:SAM-dependent methyltransferase
MDFPADSSYDRAMAGSLRQAAEYFDGDYFSWQGERAATSAAAVVPLLLELVGPASVVDVGCGSGGWLQVFAEHGVTDVVGVDGPYIDRSSLRIPADRFVAMDLEHPEPLDRTFDLALSLEAAHYLSEDAAPRLVSLLAGLAPVVVFSAAIPGQPGGPGHNPQWPSYWADLFAAHGFDCHDVLRPRLWERVGVDWWYAQNALLLARPGPAPALGESTGRPLPLVHPKLFQEVVSQAAEDRQRQRWLARRLRRGRDDA